MVLHREHRLAVELDAAVGPIEQRDVGLRRSLRPVSYTHLTLPKGATQTHISLFDGSNCGIQLDGKPVFSVQYHPEASPGPRDSHYLFQRFADLMRQKKSA